MRIFTEPCKCCVCGGDGLARIDQVWTSWLGMMRHSDPAICAEILKEQEEEIRLRQERLDRLEAEMADRLLKAEGSE